MVYNLTLAVNYLDVNMDGYCRFKVLADTLKIRVRQGLLIHIKIECDK